MIRKVATLAGLVGLLLCSCKTYTIEDLPDRQLHFGKGGGFTGMTTEYMLLSNGQLFVREGRAGSGDWRELERVKKSAATALYKTWENNEVFEQEVRQPGNMYYFINMKKDSVDFRQSWGANGYRPDESLKSFFEQAMQLIPQAAPDPIQK